MTQGELGRLLDAARVAAPADRILHRDAIAAHGSAAIWPMVDWLAEPDVGAFAVRVLEKVAEAPAHRGTVKKWLASVDRASLTEGVRRDVAAALDRLGGAGSPGRGGLGKRPPAREWPGDRHVSALELRFHEAMLDIFRLAGEATRRPRPDGTVARGYWASYFLRGVRNHGGLAYARRLLRAQGTTEGFRRLTEEHRLDLTVENLVLKPEFAELFTDEDRRVAAHRLAEAGYQAAGPGGDGQ